MSYVPVKAVSAFLWGKRVGVIVHAYDQYSRFEYDPEFRRSGLEIAPFTMPTAKAIYTADEFELPRRAFMGFSRITDEDILLVGERYGIGTAPEVLAQVKSAALPAV